MITISASTLGAPGESLKQVLSWVHETGVPADPTPLLIGDGTLPTDDFAELLIEKGYAGPVTQEWEKKWHPTAALLNEALASKRRWADRHWVDLHLVDRHRVDRHRVDRQRVDRQRAPTAENVK